MEAAPVVGRSAAAAADGDDATLVYVLALIRDLREEAQNLQTAAAEIGRVVALPDPAVRDAEFAATAKQTHALFAANSEHIEGIFATIDSILGSEQAYAAKAALGDGVTRLANYWERVTLAWPAQGDDVFAHARKLAAVGGYLDRIVYQVGLMTIPSRANNHLDQLRVGQAVDFNAMFRDEIADDAQRTQILAFIAAHPAVLHGVVDLDKGLIYKIATRTRRRVLSVVLVLAVALAGFGLVYLFGVLPQVAPLPGWPDVAGRLPALLLSYFFLLLGSVVHIVVDAVKQARAQTGVPLLALENWYLWIHIKELPLIVTVLSLWIAFFALIFLGQKDDWQTAFFVGYGIDSFVDVFLQKFGSTASSRTAAVRAVLP